MGQVRTVQVHRLLTEDTVDERMRGDPGNKALLFDAFARESDAKDADVRAVDAELHRPPGLDDVGVPLERRVVLAEEYRLLTQRRRPAVVPPLRASRLAYAS